MATETDISYLQNSSLDIDSLRQETYTAIESFPHIDKPLSYQDFFHDFLLPNKPCVLGTWATEAWASRTDWVEETGRPNLAFLKERFGSAVAPVANCCQEEYSSHPKDDMTVSEFMTYWESRVQADCSPQTDCLYLKDWHLTKAFPDYEAYRCPPYFSSDWLNEYWDSLGDGDDYRFVYMGPKGSWTSFHADVFRSYSWSANICGRKRWVFFPPGEEDNLKDRFDQLVFDLDSPDLNDPGKYPRVSKVKKRLEVIQEAGEVIYVPSGWHHQVYNLEDTISINHNWLNACNIDFTWRFLVDSLEGVEKEIADCRDMEGWAAQCQMILRASTGINYAGFYRLLDFIAHQRLKLLNTLASSTTNVTPGTDPENDNRSPGRVTSDGTLTDHASDTTSSAQILRNDSYKEHEYSSPHLHINQVVFDLLRVVSLVTIMMSCPEFAAVSEEELGGSAQVLVSSITQATGKYISP